MRFIWTFVAAALWLCAATSGANGASSLTFQIAGPRIEVPNLIQHEVTLEVDIAVYARLVSRMGGLKEWNDLPSKLKKIQIRVSRDGRLLEVRRPSIVTRPFDGWQGPLATSLVISYDYVLPEGEIRSRTIASIELPKLWDLLSPHGVAPASRLPAEVGAFVWVSERGIDLTRDDFRVIPMTQISQGSVESRTQGGFVAKDVLVYQESHDRGSIAVIRPISCERALTYGPDSQ